MLINEPKIFEAVNNPILAVIAELNGNKQSVTRHHQGVYEQGHFGTLGASDGYNEYPKLSINPYGVCDGWQQVLERCLELEADPTRKFVLTVTPVVRENQSAEGGWRWHKWGPYIGNQTPTHEYLYDEPEIDRVYCYHIVEQLSTDEGTT